MHKLLFSVVLLFSVIGVFYNIAKINQKEIVNSNVKENYNSILIATSEKDDVKSSYSFSVDLADNPLKRELGLSYRKNMCDNCGMFFSFPKEDFYAFWMKDMNFDIDIIFVDNKNNIVDIIHNVKKNGYNKKSPELSEKIKNTKPASYVLEVNAGKAKEHNLKIGDSVVLE